MTLFAFLLISALSHEGGEAGYLPPDRERVHLRVTPKDYDLTFVKINIVAEP